ncbi:MAG TPA: GNAT family protein [Candidatus Dormibacteraeota bacterium]|nr:GNAT family protein [Candidatus Dormibacteraeota bacterium]
MSERVERVRLRHPERGDMELLEELAGDEARGPWDAFDDPPDQMLTSAQFEGGMRIVELEDGTAVGRVSYIRLPWGPNRLSLAWRIGITVHPAWRRRGIGAAAQRRLASDLLAASSANRVEADTDIENIPEQRALERAGFRREGVARGAQYRLGRWHDRVLYGVVRGDL